jgi:soluble epoxide hydrolase / lipid-phosphate phosphatase
MKENSDVLFDILHAPDSWKDTFCTEGGMRKALENRGEGFNIKRLPYATEEAKKAFIERFKRDGFEAPTCCELLSPTPARLLVGTCQGAAACLERISG